MAQPQASSSASKQDLAIEVLSSSTNVTSIATPVESPRPAELSANKDEDPEGPGDKKHHHHHHHSEEGDNCAKHVKGFLWLVLLLMFHFVCFVGTISMGLGVGVLGAELHEVCWDKPLDPFWATYIMIVFVYVASQLYYQLIVDTKFNKWMTKKMVLHRIELFFIPRGLYLGVYIFAIVNLYLQYIAVHEKLHQLGKPSENDANNSLNNSTDNNTSSSSTCINAVGTLDMPMTMSTISPLSKVYDGYQHSTFFILSLAYMMYAITKESDWNTHRMIVKASGGPDPLAYGSFSNLLILVAVHFLLTIIYSLPLIGFGFIMFKFVASTEVTYFTMTPIAAFVGAFGSVLERRTPFPRSPMKGPVYAFENHLRARLILIHYWLIPMAAGRFFNSNWSKQLDAMNYDFLVFCVEICVGIIHVSKIICNDIYLYYANWGFDKNPVEDDNIGVPKRDSYIIGDVEEGEIVGKNDNNGAANINLDDGSGSGVAELSTVTSLEFGEVGGNASTSTLMDGDVKHKLQQQHNQKNAGIEEHDA